jgi:hypothetical protein
VCPNSSFHLNKFYFEKYYQYSITQSQNIMKPSWCIAIHRGLYNGIKSATTGAMVWEIST